MRSGRLSIRKLDVFSAYKRCRFSVLLVVIVSLLVILSLGRYLGLSYPKCPSHLASFNISAEAFPVSQADTLTVSSEPYEWRNVPIEGMGFVTGLVIHPTEPDLVYARTDVGGVFRWNESTLGWAPLMDMFGGSQWSYYSIESIALDPANPDVIYAAVGPYTSRNDGKVLKSRDRGQTWSSINLKTSAGAPVRMGASEEWRWAGERLAVDPNNSRIVYFGSRLDGLYRSVDGGASWKQVTSFSATGALKGGIPFVVFDSRSRITEGSLRKSSKTLYVGVIGSGVYRSTDGGTSWQRLSNGPAANQNPQQAAVATDGTLYVTFFTAPSDPQGEVWKYTRGQWIKITPEAHKNYTAITVDPKNPDVVMTAEYPVTPEGIYRTTNGGRSWQPIRLNVKAVKWWPNWHLYTLMGGLAIDPHNSKRVWLTNGFGVMRTEDITDHPSDWCTYMKNLEELVVFVVKSPPLAKGAFLFSGVADMDGFRHASLTAVPDNTYDNGKFGDTTGIDFSEADPNIVVRVGSSPGKRGREDSQVRAAYSNDNGRTWQPFANPPAGAANGKIAVSATLQPNGKPIIVWAPQGDVYPHRSLDGGKTWLPVQGAPNRTTLQLWFPNQAIASDRLDGNFFYLYKYNEQPNQGRFYRSTDGGATWEQTVTGLPDSYQHTVKAVPGMRKEVWLRVQGSPLYRSSDAGMSFTPIANVQQANEFAFGKAAPGRTNPTVFVSGIVNQAEGLYRSDDATALPGNAADARWVKVSTARQALGNMTFLEGDRLVFGRVFVGTSGRGILYGQPLLSSSKKVIN